MGLAIPAPFSHSEGWTRLSADAFGYGTARSPDHVLATTAVGGSYLSDWIANSSSGWVEYADRFGLGIVLFDRDLQDGDRPATLNPSWQKLLVPARIREQLPSTRSVCLIDTDIIISPSARNIFAHHVPGTFSVVSQVARMPYSHHHAARRLAFLRNRYYGGTYPLDSALFMSAEDVFRHVGLPVHADYFCAGVVALDTGEDGDLMAEWYREALVATSAEARDFDWEQSFLNDRIQRTGRVTWLDYGFQALWIFEAACKYPFLFSRGGASDTSTAELVRECILASLWDHDFLHFAGGWPESRMWRLAPRTLAPDEVQRFSGFRAYAATPVTGRPVGKVLPEDPDD